MNPNSLKNLIPNSERTAKELSEMGRKGGIASGKERHRQAIMKAYFRKRLKDMYIAEALTEQEYEDFKKWQRYRRKKDQQKNKK